MTEFAPQLPHGAIEEVFENVFFVTGTMRGEFFGSVWQFSRNMTIVREGERLTLLNAVRLDEAGLAALDALGTVTQVVRLGSMHGLDDAFYLDRYEASYWGLPAMPGGDGPPLDRELGAEGALPFGGASLFVFEATKLPECILRLDREGGIMIACDALQNWVGPDAYFDDETVQKMKDMGFFARAGVGPAWIHVNEPKPEDFARLGELSYKHALCGHGEPLRDTAADEYRATFARLFEV